MVRWALARTGEAFLPSPVQEWQTNGRCCRPKSLKLRPITRGQAERAAQPLALTFCASRQLFFPPTTGTGDGQFFFFFPRAPPALLSRRPPWASTPDLALAHLLLLSPVVCYRRRGPCRRSTPVLIACESRRHDARGALRERPSLHSCHRVGRRIKGGGGGCSRKLSRPLTTLADRGCSLLGAVAGAWVDAWLAGVEDRAMVDLRDPAGLFVSNRVFCQHTMGLERTMTRDERLWIRGVRRETTARTTLTSQRPGC